MTPTLVACLVLAVVAGAAAVLLWRERAAGSEPSPVDEAEGVADEVDELADEEAWTPAEVEPDPADIEQDPVVGEAPVAAVPQPTQQPAEVQPALPAGFEPVLQTGVPLQARAEDEDLPARMPRRDRGASLPPPPSAPRTASRRDPAAIRSNMSALQSAMARARATTEAEAAKQQPDQS